MKNVLIITYYWPPAGGVMMSRIFRFYQHLREYGWNPIILTVQDGDFPIYDSSLLEEIDEKTLVLKTRNIRLQRKARDKASNQQKALYGFTDKTNDSIKNKILKFIKYNFIPDTRVLWSLFAVKDALKRLHGESIDLIFSSSPPQTNHIIAKKIKEKTGIPWVADLRDPWSDVFWMNNEKIRLSFIDYLDKKIEKHTLSLADSLITVTPQLQTKYTSKYGACDLILNGYESTYYDHATTLNRQDNKVEIIYSGSMSYDQKPDLLFSLLSQLKKTNSDLYAKITVRFIGAFPGFLTSMIDSYQLQDSCVIEPFIPLHELANRLVSADLLFLTGVINCDYGIIPSKLYDYIAARRPILGVNLDHDAESILNTSGLGRNFTDDQYSSALEFLIQAVHRQCEIHPNEDFIKSLSRRNQTQQLARIFDDVWNRRNH